MWRLREPFDRARPDFPVGTPFWRDRSFTTLLERCKALEALREYLPLDLNRPIYQGQERVEAVRSAYKDHGYGYFFYALARAFRPRSCVELGILQGFSLLAVAAALRDNGAGSIQGVDLFEDYPHRHAQYADVENHISACGLENRSGITRADALAAHRHHDDIDYLHVDLSNDGDTYRFVFRHWAGKVRHAILLEGGSADRDQVEWMVKHGKSPIVPAIDEIRRAYSDWTIAVLAPFPSLTVAVRSTPEQN
ncbi:MAG TPA: class I SAM-dependent methyltransferase [Burkholderiales bacterium]|nr:class I SAM-dependent methyltransferase [Burkholderiales bacterium]